MSAKEMKKGKEGKKEGKSVVKSGNGQKKACDMKDFGVKRRDRCSRNMGVKDEKGKVRGSERGNE
jgi:hypothetical protein